MPFRNPTTKQLLADLEGKAQWSSDEAELEFQRRMRKVEMGWARTYRAENKLEAMALFVRSSRLWHKKLMDKKWRKDASPEPHDGHSPK